MFCILVQHLSLNSWQRLIVKNEAHSARLNLRREWPATTREQIGGPKSASSESSAKNRIPSSRIKAPNPNLRLKNNNFHTLLTLERS